MTDFSLVVRPVELHRHQLHDEVPTSRSVLVRGRPLPQHSTGRELIARGQYLSLHRVLPLPVAERNPPHPVLLFGVNLHFTVRGLPIAVPITSPEITSSTRRFCCRPLGVSFEATG